MTTYYLSIGGNAPDSCELLRRLIDRLERDYVVTGLSDIYTTAATNGRSPDYYNAVVRIESDIDAATLNLRFKELERLFGRTPECKLSGIVPIDIDIVVADGAVLRPRDFAAPYFKTGFDALELVP